MADEMVVGVDLGGTKVSVGAVCAGEVRRMHGRRISADEAEEVVLGEMIDAIAEVFDDDVVGIGCGVPSVVDLDTGELIGVENIPSWRRVPLRARLEDRFGVPVFVNNDANAFVVGEHVFGKGRGFGNLVGITLGTGMGTGVIVDGRLYCGSNCGAGEIGSIPHKGLTVEDFCSGRFFAREAEASGDTVYQQARAGDAEAVDLYRRFGLELAFAVQVVLYAYDPDAIILGGSIAAAFDLFQASMWEGLSNFDYPGVLERLLIAPSELEDSALLGAAALYLEASAREE